MQHQVSPTQLSEFAASFNDRALLPKPNTYWSQYKPSGTSLWLDTGDIDSARHLWSSDFSALTTNNTLLNAEVQKGLYDTIIPQIANTVKGLSKEDTIKEIAFCLNAIHGLRLTSIFGCKVSVELHTDLAHDVQGIVSFGERLHRVCPDLFIIKVPFTAAGLIGARQLFYKDIPVNMTLEFSARQNIFAALIAEPSYCNVFLGRLGAYLANNQLGDSAGLGEKVTSETQTVLRSLADVGLSRTKLIAASLRDKEQLPMLIGTDVFTIPVGVAKDAVTEGASLKPTKLPAIQLKSGTTKDDLMLNSLFGLNKEDYAVAHYLNRHLPETPEELLAYARQHGCSSLFPEFSTDDLKALKDDGKIPNHGRWAQRIKKGEVGIDALLNMAGLYSFIHDQAQLDQRIADLLK